MGCTTDQRCILFAYLLLLVQDHHDQPACVMESSYLIKLMEETMGQEIPQQLTYIWTCPWTACLTDKAFILLKTKNILSWDLSPQVSDYQDFSIIRHQIKEMLPYCIVLTPAIPGAQRQFLHPRCYDAISHSNARKTGRWDMFLILLYTHVFQAIT
jgi:hypothetical protein